MLKMSSTSLHFTYSFNLFLKLGTTSFFGKFSHVFSRATFNSDTAFGYVEKSFVHHSPDISAGGSKLFLLDHLQTVLMQALLSDPIHLAESAAPSSSSRLQSSINFGSRN